MLFWKKQEPSEGGASRLPWWFWALLIMLAQLLVAVVLVLMGLFRFLLWFLQFYAERGLGGVIG